MPALVLVFPLLLCASGAQSLSPVKPAVYANVELVISGPATMPLFRKSHGEKFTAVLINRSTKPIAFVPPHRDWDEEIFTTWDATDAKGRCVTRIPHYQMFCVIATMYQRTIFAPTLLDPSHPKTIEDKDLLILQPGEQFELPGIADPSFNLNFPRRGTYQVTLAYSFYPEHYVVAPGSKKAALLKDAPSISATSNPLALTLN
jgi:hypothetical protein